MPPVTSPDLAAFLILQMDVLSEVAERFGKADESAYWKSKSDEMLDKLFTILFKDGVPNALHGLDNQVVLCDSLLLYIPIVLGDRLPKHIRENYIAVLKSNQFVTSYGFATESPASKYYESDGYWRGPIWAPSTFIILDGLCSCGEEEYVRQMAARFCEMMCKSGCAENFDAITTSFLDMEVM